MTAARRPRRLMEFNEDGARVSIVDDERQPFGSRTISFNDIGFERFHGLIEEYSCNGLEIHYHGISNGKVSSYLRPNFDAIRRPDAILELTIGEAGAFAPDFDYTLLGRFQNVRALTLYSIQMKVNVERLFPKLEMLRLMDWKKNKLVCQPRLWPKLRYLHLSGFKGDLSLFQGWDIRSLFLVASTVQPFDSVRTFTNLETLHAAHLGGQIDLTALSDLVRLRNLSIAQPRRPLAATAFASKSIEMMILQKIDAIDLQGFPNLKIYGIGFGGSKRLDKWDSFDAYGDPFAAVHFRRFPYAD